MPPISDGFFVSYDAGGSAAAIYLNESNSPLYLAYLAMFSPDGTNLIYDASALNNLLPTLGQPDLAGWGVTNFASVAATPAFFGNMPQSVFELASISFAAAGDAHMRRRRLFQRREQSIRSILCAVRVDVPRL